jgi:dienelactone hydrolase
MGPMPCIKRLPRLILSALIILLAVAGCFPGPAPLLVADPNPSSPGVPGSSTPVAGPLPPPSSPTPAGPYIAVDPPRSFNDSPVRVRLSGLTPGQTVTLRANLADTYGSYASFVAGDDGSVDLAQHAPVAGSYSQLNPMGLFWTAQVYPGVDAFSAPILLDSYPVTLTLEGGGETLARTTITRVFMDEGATRRKVNEDGLVGVYFRPAGPGPFPALILTGGTDLDPHYSTAAALASRGYAALTLFYYGRQGLPDELNLVPLEYFEKAIAWLQAQDGVAGDQLGVMGWSAGGQLALLLGATFPQFRTVVAYVPAAVVSEGTLNGGFSGQSRYTFRGQPLTYVRGSALVNWDDAFRAARQSDADPQSALAATLAGIDASSYSDAAISVENTHGPVLLISSVDDDAWPSALFAEMAMRRLRAQGHPFADQHLMYEGSGHLIGTPYGPARPDASLGVETYLASGPTFDGTDRASADSWPRVLQFLAASLK